MEKRKRGRPRIRNGIARTVVLEADLVELIEQIEPADREFSSKLNVLLRRIFTVAPALAEQHYVMPLARQETR